MIEESNPESVTIMRVLAVAWTVGIVMAGILPLSNFVGHSHWEYVKWVPTFEDLRSPGYALDLVIDVIVNTLLFVPFGYLFNRSIAHDYPHQRLMIIAAAAVLSCSIELFQVYCHNRFPSPYDIATNVTGSLLGLHLAPLPSRRMDVPPSPPYHSHPTGS